LLSGLGAATADGFYGTIVALGITAISSLLLDNRIILTFFGGIFLVYLGVSTLRASFRPTNTDTNLDEAPEESPSLWGAYTSTFILTLTNPMTILAFVGVFAGLGVADVTGETSKAIVMVTGVFVGSALWWLTLSFGVSLIRSRVKPSWMVWINRISGFIIAVFGLLLLVDMFTGAV